jgi:hypothetical protein
MGPQFFETVMGRMFFDGHVPKLIRALERIGDALEQKLPAPAAEQEEVMTVHDAAELSSFALLKRLHDHLESHNAHTQLPLLLRRGINTRLAKGAEPTARCNCDDHCEGPCPVHPPPNGPGPMQPVGGEKALFYLRQMYKRLQQEELAGHFPYSLISNVDALLTSKPEPAPIARLIDAMGMHLDSHHWQLVASDLGVTPDEAREQARAAGMTCS